MRVGVVGGGVVGLAATAALVRAGIDVVCFERSDVLMGERSAGSSRIFRLAHTDPELVRLAETARDGFARWAAEVGRPMVDLSGCVISGADAHERGTAMEAVGAPYEWGDGLAVAARLPAAGGDSCWPTRCWTGSRRPSPRAFSTPAGCSRSAARCSPAGADRSPGCRAEGQPQPVGDRRGPGADGQLPQGAAQR